MHIGESKIRHFLRCAKCQRRIELASEGRKISEAIRISNVEEADRNERERQAEEARKAASEPKNAQKMEGDLSEK